jgi:hypothetical protein
MSLKPQHNRLPMHRRVSDQVSPGIKFCGLPAYDHQTGHPNEVSPASGENYTANIVLIYMQDSLSHQTT